MIKEDDQLNINNEEIARSVEMELNLTSNERKKILVFIIFFFNESTLFRNKMKISKVCLMNTTN